MNGHYTRESAEQILPEVKQRLIRLRDAYRQAASHQVDGTHEGNGAHPHAEESIEASRVMADEVRWLTDRGIVVRDIEEGLVDFPSLRDGEEIHLCWKMDEGSIGFWHYPDAGFGSRQPL